jgi:hypothetical protein
MARAMRKSEPNVIPEGGWHLPYVDIGERHLYPLEKQRMMSTARCCRVSYLTMDGKPAEPQKDFVLHDQLIKDMHMSPLEHCAQSMEDPNFRSGNFRGWKQYRQTIPGQAWDKFDYNILDQFEDDYLIE